MQEITIRQAAQALSALECKVILGLALAAIDAEEASKGFNVQTIALSTNRAGGNIDPSALITTLINLTRDNEAGLPLVERVSLNFIAGQRADVLYALTPAGAAAAQWLVSHWGSDTIEDIEAELALKPGKTLYKIIDAVKGQRLGLPQTQALSKLLSTLLAQSGPWGGRRLVQDTLAALKEEASRLEAEALAFAQAQEQVTMTTESVAEALPQLTAQLLKGLGRACLDSGPQTLSELSVLLGRATRQQTLTHLNNLMHFTPPLAAQAGALGGNATYDLTPLGWQVFEDLHDRKSPAEVKALQSEWLNSEEPEEWPLEVTPGFEAHVTELRAWCADQLGRWQQEREAAHASALAEVVEKTSLPVALAERLLALKGSKTWATERAERSLGHMLGLSYPDAGADIAQLVSDLADLAVRQAEEQLLLTLGQLYADGTLKAPDQQG